MSTYTNPSNTDPLIAGYLQYLAVESPERVEAVKKRTQTQQGKTSVRAEAAVACAMRVMGYRPVPLESPSTGGPDFLCTFTGTPVIRRPIRVSNGEIVSSLEPYLATALGDSVFLRPQGNAATGARESISAILLGCIRDTDIALVGALHPQPVVPLDADGLPGVPLARLVDCPASQNEYKVEWVVEMPQPKVIGPFTACLYSEELPQAQES